MRNTLPLASVVAALTLLAGTAALQASPDAQKPNRPDPWESRATPESQGHIVEVDGKRIQQRHPFMGGDSPSYEQYPTHAYETLDFPPPQQVQVPEGLKGDPAEGLRLFKSRQHGPCVACHVIPDPEVWPIGNVGPDLRTIGARGVPDSYIYQTIYDPRAIFGTDTPMAPFGVVGILDEQEIMHLVAYLQTLTGDPFGVPEEVTEDKQWNPYTRDVVRPEYGDPLDAFTNPGLMATDDRAVPLWSKAGPTGKSCADCHGQIEAADDLRPLGVIPEMVGVAAGYPRWFDEYGRMMSIEDLLAVHAPETTGLEMPAQGQDNLTMSILVRMQSNGMPYQLETDNPNVQAAIARGQELFHRPVGQRQHACADCHTERGGADKFLGGRFLANIEDGMINHPYWRTAQQRIWDIRIRMQWCMTPLGTNYLPGDAPEYADLETFITSKQQGKVQVLVPRESH
jgi:L-cysteine S-thiosulfotransferase